MQKQIDPQILNFILDLSMYLLIAFGILAASVAVVYATLFYKGNFSGSSIATIIQQTDVPKLATIIMIVLAASLLAMLGIIQGEAVIALLSGIAGYVLGNQRSKDDPSDIKKVGTR